MSMPGKEAFKAAIGSHFSVALDDGGEVRLRLDEVTDKAHLDTAKMEHFQLLFSAPKERPLGQASFNMTHETLGPLFIFLVPVHEEDGRMDYEAVFCRKIGGD